MFFVTQVGSWPRSRELLRALREKQKNQISGKEFDSVADEAVRRCVQIQLDAGADIVVDGEQRRDNFYSFITDKVAGTRLMSLAEMLETVENKAGFEEMLTTLDVPASAIRNPTCIGKLSRHEPLAVHELRFVRQLTDKPVKVVGNYMDLHWWKKVQKQAQRDPNIKGVTIGWAGGRRPDSDIEPMVKAWGRIAAKYDKVTFVIQGHSSDMFFDNVPYERIAVTSWMPIETYPAGLVNIDIGCCPLDESQFNRSKSFIKAMEYAASNAAVVASPMVYDGLIEHGKDGFIATTVDEWELYLSKLVEDYTLRHDMSKRLLAKVRKDYSIETNAWRWIQAWTDIVSNFRESYRRPHILLPEGVDYYARTQ